MRNDRQMIFDRDNDKTRIRAQKFVIESKHTLKSVLFFLGTSLLSFPVASDSYVIDTPQTTENAGQSFSNGDSLTITKSGSIITNIESDAVKVGAIGFFSLNNAGTIDGDYKAINIENLTGGLASDNAITNSGSIYGDTEAISAGGAPVTLINTGTISSESSTFHTIKFASSDSILDSSGLIENTDPKSRAIEFTGSTSNNRLILRAGSRTQGSLTLFGTGHEININGKIENTALSPGVLIGQGRNKVSIMTSGRIITRADTDDFYYSTGLSIQGDSNIIDIQGGIETYGRVASGIWLNSSQNVVNINGTVKTYNEKAHGINTWGNLNEVKISGAIISDNSTSIPILDSGQRNRYTINGLIKASNASSVAISSTKGTQNTFRIAENARIIGTIETNDAAENGNTLQFDVGSAMSYVYNTTGLWSLEDLDGRPVVQGSAMAAGIGHAETADELQFIRLNALNSSLSSSATTNVSASQHERRAWVDPFYLRYERKSSNSDPNASGYDSYSYGFNMGLPGTFHGKKFDLLLGAQETNIDIDNGSQKIDVTSLRFGLTLPELLKLSDNFHISALSTIGYNNYNMTRKVLVNSNTTSGITNYDADYNSWELIAGLDTEYKKTILTSETALTASFGINLIYEHLDSFSETAHFSWDSRNILQGVTKAALGLNHTHANGIESRMIASIQTRDVLDGKTTHYSIDNTSVNFSGGAYNETISQLELGAKYQSHENLELSLNLLASKSTNKTDMLGVAAGIRWAF